MRTWAVDIPFSCSCCPQPRCAHTTYWNLTLSSRKQRRIEHIWKPCKSPKLAPVVTKKRSGQSVKPNDKHNIYKFQFCSLTLKKMYSLFLCVVGFFFSFFCFFFGWVLFLLLLLFFCPRSLLQSSVRDGSLAPECGYPKQTGHHKEGGGQERKRTGDPAHLAFTVYVVWVMSVKLGFQNVSSAHWRIVLSLFSSSALCLSSVCPNVTVSV